MIGRLLPTLFVPFLLFACSSRPGEIIPPREAAEKIRAGALVVDVRTYEEYGSGHVENALNIPHTEIEESLDKLGSDKQREIVLYCRSGRRSGLAKDALRERGYNNVHNAGGYSDLAELDLSR